MAKVTIRNVLPKTFSSHPGHGSAASTVAHFKAAADKSRQVFPASHPPKRSK